MKIVKNIAILSCFIVLLLNCKTANLEQVHKIYANKSIDSTIKADPQYVQEIFPYKKQLDSIMSQSVTFAKEDFTKTGYSSNEGNLLADLVLNFSKKYTKDKTIAEPDFCLLNIGGVRTIIPKGVVTVGNIFEVAPFENELVFIQLNGEQMNEMFDYLGAEKKGHPLAGAKILYKDDKLYKVEIQGKPFDANKKYWVVTLDYLMHGGDRMYFFTKSGQTVVPSIRLRDALLEQMKKYEVLPESKEERLIFEN